LPEERNLVVDDQLEEQKRLYTIGQAITAQTDPAQVGNRLVEAAVYVAAADGGLLFLRDPETDEIRLQSRLMEGQQVAETQDRVVEDPLVRRVLLTGAPHILSGPSINAIPTPAPAVIDVPLLVRNECTGVLRVLRTKPGNPFDSLDHHKLSVLASYASLALENANLNVALQNAVESTAICQISTFFSSKLRLAQVLEMVMDVAARIVNADRGYIMLLNPRSGQFDPSAAYAFSIDQLDELWFVPAKQIVHKVLATREAVYTVTEAIPLEDDQVIPSRPALCVPVEGMTGLIGTIYVERTEPDHPFTEHQVSTLSMLSGNAAIALDNARLFDQVEAESQKLDAVLRGTDQPVIVTDDHGTVLLMNRAASRLFGTEGRKGTGLLFPSAVENRELVYLLEQARISAEVQRSEIAAGEDRTFGVTVTPIPEIGAVTVLQDITEIKKLSQLKTEFVATVSHDLRSPLSAVQGFLSVLDQAGPVTDQQADFIESAQREVTRLFDLTQDLLDLGRLESGIDLDMEPCDIRELVETAVVGWKGRAADKQILLTWDLPAAHILVQGNAALLRRVVDNLLSNACKYTLPDGQIEVQLNRVGREVVIQFEDSGIGIPAQDQPYVFDRFYRVRNDYTRDIDGTGLGLAIVRSIVERHEGRVWLKSEEGQGTTVGVVLPVIS